jgi:nitrite reductase (NADH) large subunit
VGANAFVPPFPGVDCKNVTVLRTVADADAILDVVRAGTQCVCIGGGILGLETAGALARRGVKVTLVEGYGWLLPRQLNRRAGELLEAYVRSLGITLRKNARTQEIVGDGQVREVRFEDGSFLPADLVIITTGVRSNTYLARQAGLEVNNGVVVDHTLRTSHPDVYAAGDVAEHRGVTYGLWGPAQFQGTIAGMNAAGDQAEFAGIPRSNMLKVLGYDMFSIGQIGTEDASYHPVDGEWEGGYFYFSFRDNHLVGSILLGDTALSATVKKVIEKRLDCSGVLQKHHGAREVVDFLRAGP